MRTNGENADHSRTMNLAEILAPEELSILFERMAAAPRDSKRSVYFIGGDSGQIKIGYAIDVQNRLRMLRRETRDRSLGILATAPGGRTHELYYHLRFAAYRLHGEWFERSPEIEAEIARLTALSGDK